MLGHINQHDDGHLLTRLAEHAARRRRQTQLCSHGPRMVEWERAGSQRDSFLLALLNSCCTSGVLAGMLMPQSRVQADRDVI